MTNERPLPGDHKDIARGSGPAAILLFLHIAVVGYLGFFTYYAVTHAADMGASLVELQAAVLFYLPAYFAFGSFLPTDPLSRVVGLVAKWVGLISAAVFLAVGVHYAVTASLDSGRSLLLLALAWICGIVLAAILVLLFARLTAAAREKYKKNASENEVVE